MALDNGSIPKNPTYKQLIDVLTQKGDFMEMFTNKNPTVTLSGWYRESERIVTRKEKLTTDPLSMDLWDLNRVIMEKESEVFDSDLYKKYYYRGNVQREEI